MTAATGAPCDAPLFDPVRVPRQIAIGEARIGPGQPTYIIAEIGVNHDGALDAALRLVDVAKDCGASAAKFQVFRADELTTRDAQAAAYQRRAGAASQRQMLAKLELDERRLAEIRAHCAAVGIEFLATPFGTEDVRRLRDLEVRAFKVASTDLNNTPLLREIAAARLPMIVSTGAALSEEIDRAVEFLDEINTHDQLILLHCVSAYPTPIEFANLRAVPRLRDRFGVPVGFSDHTTSTQTGAWAVAAGACVLEKHVTLNRSAAGPDHALSLEPADLREYIANVRSVEAALGTGALGMSAIERDVRRVARKSIVARRALPAGTVLAAAHMAIKRPAGGIEPSDFDRVVGRCLKRALRTDERITWDLLE